MILLINSNKYENGKPEERNSCVVIREAALSQMRKTIRLAKSFCTGIQLVVLHKSVASKETAQCCQRIKNTMSGPPY